MALVRVYGRTSSSNTQKVLWMLRHLGVEHELVKASARLGETSQLLVEHAGPDATPFGIVGTEEYKKLNPHDQIPTVVDLKTGAVVWESHACVRYVAEQYGASILAGATPAARARNSMHMDWVLAGNDYADCFGTANHHLIDAVARTPRSQWHMPTIGVHHAMYSRLFAHAETAAFGDGRFAGDSEELTVADVPLAVELNRWNVCMARVEREGLELDVPPLPKLARWYTRLMEESPAFVEAVVANEERHHEMEPGTVAALCGQPSR